MSYPGHRSPTRQMGRTVISVPEERLLSTAAVAKALGVTGKTILRYEQRGWLTPAAVLPSGHRRWRLSEVRAQLAALRERGEDD